MGQKRTNKQIQTRSKDNPKIKSKWYMVRHSGIIRVWNLTISYEQLK